MSTEQKDTDKNVLAQKLTGAWTNFKQGKIIAFTIEWGRSHASTPFHPPYPEMRKVMRDVTAGLLAMCLQVR